MAVMIGRKIILPFLLISLLIGNPIPSSVPLIVSIVLCPLGGANPLGRMVAWWTLGPGSPGRVPCPMSDQAAVSGGFITLPLCVLKQMGHQTIKGRRMS
jgi:hypothetical protein